MIFADLKKNDIISYVYYFGDETIKVDTLKVERFLPSKNDIYFSLLTIVIDTTNEDTSLIGHEDEFSIPVIKLYSDEYNSLLLSIDKNDIERKKIKTYAKLFQNRNKYFRKCGMRKKY
jgi:hypothetical protein